MNKLLFFGGVLGFISVMMGALGDHAFTLTPDQVKGLLTAIRYNMLYAVIIMGLSLAPPEKQLHIPGYLFTVGVFLFSFSIYAAQLSGISALTYITPLGGLTIMAGWVALVIKAFRYHK